MWNNYGKPIGGPEQRPPQGDDALGVMDEASRHIVAYGVFKEAAAPNALQILKEEIQHYGETDEILTDPGTHTMPTTGKGRRRT